MAKTRRRLCFRAREDKTSGVHPFLGHTKSSQALSVIVKEKFCRGLRQENSRHQNFQWSDDVYFELYGISSLDHTLRTGSDRVGMCNDHFGPDLAQPLVKDKFDPISIVQKSGFLRLGKTRSEFHTVVKSRKRALSPFSVRARKFLTWPPVSWVSSQFSMWVSVKFLWPMRVCNACAYIAVMFCTSAGTASCLLLNMVRPWDGRDTA